MYAAWLICFCYGIDPFFNIMFRWIQLVRNRHPMAKEPTKPVISFSRLCLFFFSFFSSFQLFVLLYTPIDCFLLVVHFFIFDIASGFTLKRDFFLFFVDVT